MPPKVKAVSIKKLPVRIIKKGKTRGRPSKMELTASKFISWQMEQPEMRNVMRKMQEDMLLKGWAQVEVPKFTPKSKKRGWEVKKKPRRIVLGEGMAAFIMRSTSRFKWRKASAIFITRKRISDYEKIDEVMLKNWTLLKGKKIRLVAELLEKGR